MRIRNSFLNIIFNCACYLALMISGFFVRRIFAEILGMKCVDIDGRFNDYISIISTIELGLGINMAYKLYDPIAKNDWPRISSILKFIKNAYSIIIVSTIAIGSCFSILAINSIKDCASRDWLERIFLLYLVDGICSYFCFYKRAMITADQKSRIIGLTRMICIIILSVFHIFILYVFKSFEMYLILKIISKTAENIVISHVFNKKYKEINIKEAVKFSKDEKKEIFHVIKAMFFHRLGGISLRPITTIIFSVVSTIPSIESAKYYNYMIIVSSLLGISSEFFRSMMASFGNLLHTENNEKIENNLDSILFFNFLIYSFFCSSFFIVSGPFMKIWIPNSVLDLKTTFVIVLYMYTYGMRQGIEMVKTSAGIYIQDRHFPLLECIVNFVSSYFLAMKFGLKGAIIGSIISSMLVSFFSQPFFSYKIIFNKKPTKFYFKYLIYTLFSFSEIFICYYFSSLININSDFTQMLVNSILCLIISSFMNIIFFHKTKEFKHLISAFREVFPVFGKS